MEIFFLFFFFFWTIREVVGDLLHEGSTRSDAVRVEARLVALGRSRLSELLPDLLLTLLLLSMARWYFCALRYIGVLRIALRRTLRPERRESDAIAAGSFLLAAQRHLYHRSVKAVQQK